MRSRSRAASGASSANHDGWCSGVGSGLGVLALALACSSIAASAAPRIARADDPAKPAAKKPDAPKPDAPKPAPAKPSGAKPDAGKPAGESAGRGAGKGEPERREAVVVDEFDVEMRVEGAELFQPPSGLLSSGKSKPLEKLVLRQGAHEVHIATGDLAAIQVEGQDGNDLKVTVQLRDGKKATGAVDRDLEVRGTVDLGDYQIRLQRAKRVVFRSS